MTECLDEIEFDFCEMNYVLIEDLRGDVNETLNEIKPHTIP